MIIIECEVFVTKIDISLAWPLVLMKVKHKGVKRCHFTDNRWATHSSSTNTKTKSFNYTRYCSMSIFEVEMIQRYVFDL